MPASEQIPITEDRDVIAVRGAGRALARELGFGSADQTRLATAISELARNVLNYAGEGICVIRDESNDQRARIVVEVEDEGPGIVDVDQAMEDGYTSSGGLGAGLPGAKRLVHEFKIESSRSGTLVTIGLSRRK